MCLNDRGRRRRGEGQTEAGKQAIGLPHTNSLHAEVKDVHFNIHIKMYIHKMYIHTFTADLCDMDYKSYSDIFRQNIDIQYLS